MQRGRIVRELERDELSMLQENFRSYIKPHLSEQNQEDYELIWGWEKFMFDKTERAKAPERDDGL